MTNEGLKKKIIEILEETEYEWTEEKNGYILQIFYDKLADALIAADIGDVSEYKHRAEVAERAIRIYQTQYGDVRFFNFDVAIKQAEKELKENE